MKKIGLEAFAKSFRTALLVGVITVTSVNGFAYERVNPMECVKHMKKLAKKWHATGSALVIPMAWNPPVSFLTFGKGRQYNKLANLLEAAITLTKPTTPFEGVEVIEAKNKIEAFYNKYILKPYPETHLVPHEVAAKLVKAMESGFICKKIGSKGKLDIFIPEEGSARAYWARNLFSGGTSANLDMRLLQVEERDRTLVEAEKIRQEKLKQAEEIRNQKKLAINTTSRTATKPNVHEKEWTNSFSHSENSSNSDLIHFESEEEHSKAGKF